MAFDLEKNINRIKKLCNIDETHGDAAMNPQTNTITG